MSPTESRAPRRVRNMFDGIARRYDLLNRLLSFRQDRRWRRTAAREIPEGASAPVLDLCGGTGDLTVELARAGVGSLVVCCDFSHEMLRRADPKFRRKGVASRCVTLEADGLRLPFGDATFDAVTVAFGVRNFADMDHGLREIHRVLRPAGRLIVLEFSRPTRWPMRPLYRWYLRRILPRLGDRISKNEGPYGYLARTIAEFPGPETLAGRIREAGFAACGWKLQSGGIVAVHTALKGSDAAQHV